MPEQLSRPVTFKTLNGRALVHQLDGPEPAYPVYYFGKTVRFERPEVPGQPYRWTRDIDFDE